MVIRYPYNRMDTICPKQLEKFIYLRTNGQRQIVQSLPLLAATWDWHSQCLQKQLGVLGYNKYDGDLKGAGFLTWPSIAVAPRCGDTLDKGIDLFPFSDRKRDPYPKGPRVSIFLWNMSHKKLNRCFDELRIHLGYVARGKGSEFDYDEHIPEGAGEAFD